MRAIALLFGIAAILLSLTSRAQALTAAELTPKERQRYSSLSGEAANDFLITRDYVHKAYDVVAGRLAPASFPDEPDEFKPSYLFPGDAKTPGDLKTLNTAIKMSLSAYIDSRM